MIYYLIFIYYILWLQNSNLILKSDLTARICFSDAEFSLIIYMFFLEHYSLSEKTAFFLKKHLNIVKFNNIIYPTKDKGV